MFSAPSTFPTKTDATRFLAVVEADIARGLCIDGLIPEAVDLRSKVAAPSTVARDFSALRAVLNAAVNADLIARSEVPRSPRSAHVSVYSAHCCSS
jgi:hypothetical protein